MAWTPNYITDAELKAYLRIDALDTTDDVEIGFAATSASRAIDRATRRQFGLVASAEARYYTPEWDNASSRYVVRVDDFMTVTGLLVAVDTDGDLTFPASVTSMAKHPLNAAAVARPWTRLILPPAVAPPLVEGSVRVTAKWGWTTVPGAVKQAALLQAMRFYKRKDAWAGTTGSPEMGNVTRLMDKVDVDVEVALRPYRLTVWA